MSHLHLLIPAYNEGPVIGATLANLPQTLPGVSKITIVVIDDGSRDTTAAIVRQSHDPRVVLLRHKINRGLGGAIGTGLAYAKRARADIAITYDADGQHAPEDIRQVLEPLVAGTADVVIGSRLINPKGMPRHRIIGNWGLNVITYFLFGVATTDSQSGLRGFSRKAIDSIELKMNRMEVSSEVFNEIRRLSLRHSEVPIRAIYTDYSLAKGQRSSNGINILLRLIWHRMTRD